MDTFLQLFKLLRFWRTGDADEICLFDAVARMSEAIGKLAVIGDENQAFAGAIEPTHGEDAFFSRNQINNTGSAAGVMIGGHYANGLVDSKIQPLRLTNRFSIDADLLRCRINTSA